MNDLIHCTENLHQALSHFVKQKPPGENALQIEIVLDGRYEISERGAFVRCET